ncbi:hypothetical protein DFH09DRAFT_1098563 [Mycena vulgaris]|nr:hypothetical protein DFH09DRAFT_1098563 [Mycena vulgaris]
MGVSACESLDPTFLSQERRELDPEPSRKLVAAMRRTREMQDNTDVGRTLAVLRFHHSLQSWHCNGVRANGQQCTGSISLRKLNAPDRNKNHILLCSKRTDALMVGSFHSQTRILDHVSEDLFLKRGYMLTGRFWTNGIKGEGHLPFQSSQGWLAVCCQDPAGDLRRKDAHLLPVGNTAPRAGAYGGGCPLLAVRAYLSPSTKQQMHSGNCGAISGMCSQDRPGGTVAKVENAQSTKELLGGKTPSIFHPGLINCDTKTRLIQQVKAELNESASSTTNTTMRQRNYLSCLMLFFALSLVSEVAAYITDQEALSDDKRYLHSSMSRDGKRIIFAVTVMRVWMEVHDRKAYKSVWDEVQRLVLKLTGKPLKFVGLHRGGRVLGLNPDMEAAPLLGLTDSFAPTVDLEDGFHYAELKIFSGIPNLLHLTDADRKRIFDLKYLKIREEIDAFKIWIRTLADPQGVLKRWWEHKLMHRWLLRGIIQCLSNIPLERWNTMDTTTNLGEAQHAWNNAQTGISMGVIQSFKQYEELDIRRAEEIRLRKSTAIPRNTRNEVSPRYAARTARQSRNSDKARRTHAADSNVAALQAELSETREELRTAHSDAKAEPSPETTLRVRELEATVVDVEARLKLAKGEAKSSSSGRVRASKAAVATTTLDGATDPAEPQPAQPASDEFGPATGATAGLPPSVFLPSVPAPATGVSDVAGPRRVSARKRAQVDSSAEDQPSSNKHQKKLGDPLAGWVMQDPDTGEKLSGHEWVECYPEELEGCRIVEAVNTRAVGQTKLRVAQNDRTIVWSFKNGHYRRYMVVKTKKRR